MTASKFSERPSKPYPTFPLFPHSRGYWCKKFKGKQYNCGPWDDPTAALAYWLDLRDKIEIGVDPTPTEGVWRVADMVDAFIESKDVAVQSGDLTPRTRDDYREFGQWLVDNLGHHRIVETLGPDDFTALRKTFSPSWGTVRTEKHILATRTILKWAFTTGRIERPIRFGDNFSKPSKKKKRLERRDKHKKLFEADEIHRLLAVADNPQVKAMILLGINCGYGNADCSRLRLSEVKGVWLDVPRIKTAVHREAWLWPETRQALKAALQARHKNPKPGFEDLLFLTHHGRDWVCEESRRDAVTVEFAKIKKNAKCHRQGVGFYALRHTFETIASETQDQIAVDYIMGHTDETMASVYRERVSATRVKKTCEYVRQWLFDSRSIDGTPKKRGAK